MSNEQSKSPKSDILKKLKIKKKNVQPKRDFNQKKEEKTSRVKVIEDAHQFELVATCMQNLEEELAAELRELNFDKITINRRAVSFQSDLKGLYRANIWLRTALKVLKPFESYTAKNDKELYERAKKVAWEKIFDSDKTFSIDAAVNSEEFTHSQFAALRIKDAIVDRFREQQMNRPNVERYQPDVRIHLHINKNAVTLSLDSSGDPLFKRGYRTKQHLAPINECLAAGLILKSGWRGETDFLDPMCGTATIPIEAAMIACNIPPNLQRVRFAFEGWNSYDPAVFSDVLAEAKNEYRPLKVKIFAREINSNNIRAARMNINTAQMRKSILLEQMDFFKSEPPTAEGTIIMNPPYGERLNLSDDLAGFYESVGSTLKHDYPGWTAWMIASDEESFKNIGLKSTAKIPMMNGKLACQFRKYEIFEGKLKDLSDK